MKFCKYVVEKDMDYGEELELVTDFYLDLDLKVGTYREKEHIIQHTIMVTMQQTGQLGKIGGIMQPKLLLKHDGKPFQDPQS